MKSKVKTKIILTFDLGGTSLRAGAYCQETDRLLVVQKISTPNYRFYRDGKSDKALKEFFECIYDLGKKVLNNKRPYNISCAFAGPIDLAGNALASPTIFGKNLSYPLNLIQNFNKLWPKAYIYVLNDITAAGYFYVCGEEDFCIITVSSGIGNKVFLKGRPILGPSLSGGEIGHLRIDFSPGAPVCDCGRRGHLGAIASGRASLYQISKLAKIDPTAYAFSGLGKRFGKDIMRINNESIAEFAKQGDPWTRKLVLKMAHPLGQIIAELHLGIGIERFIIIGGFATSIGECYRRALVKAARNCSWDLAKNWNRMIEMGSSDDTIGLKGAGRYAAINSNASRR
jgi:C7-cyclitol 7-kinase